MEHRLINELMRLQQLQLVAHDVVANVVNMPIDANRNGIGIGIGIGNGGGDGDGDGDGDANAVADVDGNADADGNGDGDVVGIGIGIGDEEVWQRQLDVVQMQEMRLENPQVAMLLDAPHEPPIELHHMLEPVNVPQRPRKKRSFWTISKPFPASTERCALIASGWRAASLQCAQPEQRSEYFANYLFEHLNSHNFPNGQGLPHRWGQF